MSCGLSKTLELIFRGYYNGLAEEKMQIEYDRKCCKLKGLDEKGAKANTVVSTCNIIITKLRTAIQVVDNISVTIPPSYRRGPIGLNTRPSQHSIAKASSKPVLIGHYWGSFYLFLLSSLDSLRAAGISGVEVGTKLYVSNLDPEVTNEDIKELFSEIGELKRHSGSAEVVYLRRSDAFAALKRYNNVMLDGKPMIIEIVGANADVPISARVKVTGTKGRKKRTVVMMPEAGQLRRSAGISRGPELVYRYHIPAARRSAVVKIVDGTIIRALYLSYNAFFMNFSRRGGMTMRSGRGGGGRGRGRGKRKPVEKSADDLDKELENYHAESMNVS
ncbi:THO complex subunit 4D [Hibiscus syriacus]|uniref:THO complex subunit 4D n=1 Tax=Hibiscus syriacus TaxID=106335 RepID=A0A6A2WB71_HIBSY|nr:THO complex subunit 4D [Hibiscus syriacus]